MIPVVNFLGRSYMKTLTFFSFSVAFSGNSWKFSREICSAKRDEVVEEIPVVAAAVDELRKVLKKA
jgi:hypothetical protein